VRFPIRVITLFCISISITTAPVYCADEQESGRPAPAQHANRLIREKSPYLLQHAHNPVDWYPWGDEAFRKAKDEDKPILLSIGYSTCHWCHVMEEESFSDPLVAEMMNMTFVSIKVDREERPDIDSVYMTAAQLMSGRGGWPLTILMTPEKKPFFAATYIPKEDRFDRTGLLSLIPSVARAWRERRDAIDGSAEQIAVAIQNAVTPAGGKTLDHDALANGYNSLAARFDAQRGGFLPAPKFPRAHQYLFLLRYWKRTGDATALEIVERTLQMMPRGGIYDHLGFGFHRYSTDPNWLVPHFEKMLYDQALLALAYVETYQATGKPEYRRIAEEIFTYVLRDMRDPRGGFYSAEDADSEGKEGKFYVWTEEEIRAILGADADLFAAAYGIQKDGNYKDPVGEPTGRANIIHLVRTAEQLAAERDLPADTVRQQLERARQKLFAAREKRIHPLKDDKVLTDWNGLMIAALAAAAQAFDAPQYEAAAREAADFILRTLRTKDGRLLHRYRAGDAAIAGHLDDYAFTIWGLLNLYETSFDLRYLEAAIDLERQSVALFWDDQAGGFFLTAKDAETLLARPKEIYDGATPSGNSVQFLNLLRIARITADTELESRADKLVRAVSGDVLRSPASSPHLLSGAAFALGPSFEVVLAAANPASEDTQAMRRALYSRFVPNKVVVFRPAGEEEPRIARIAPYTKPQRAIRGKATAYVCTNYNCKLPTTDPIVMLELVAEGKTSGP
jgi:uncharacterized protein YyaL (SSP411 family)